MYIKIQKLAENNVEIERIMLFFKKMYSYLETDARNHVSGCPTSDVVLPQGQESATQHWFSVLSSEYIDVLIMLHGEDVMMKPSCGSF